MSFDLELTSHQKTLKEALHALGESVIRPLSLQMDRTHEIPEDFLRNFMRMSRAFRGEEGDELGGELSPRAVSGKPSQANRTAVIGAEELAWGDAALLLGLPGP